jgi:alpha-1,3-rhamnosyl/mannosyltransferase
VKVLLDTSYALRGATGTGVYLERLAAALRDEGVDVRTVADVTRGAPGGGRVRSARNLVHDLRWLHEELPRHARRQGVDVLHHPLPAHARRLGDVAQVLTVHDLAFEVLPECFDPRFARWASRTHRAAALRTGAVVAVSRTTARDVRERWGVPADRIVVAPHGPGQWRARDVRAGRTVRDAPAPGRPYLLYVGDAEPRKDLPTLRAGYALLRDALGDGTPDLVLAGRLDVPPAPGERLVQEPDADALLTLMDGALALVHPALHEGVGLTPLEAMARGVPVVAARAPGVTETVEDAAALFPPRDADALAGVLARVATEPRMRERLVQAGRRVAGARSWTQAAQAHVAAYELALRRTRDGD